MKIVPGSGFYVKDARRVAWFEGLFPHATLIFEFEWSEVVDCPDHAALQRLTEGTLVKPEGQIACVIEYAFDDANYPLKNEPNGENFVFLLTADEVNALQSRGKLILRFEMGDTEVQKRMRKIADTAEAA